MRYIFSQYLGTNLGYKKKKRDFCRLFLWNSPWRTPLLGEIFKKKRPRPLLSPIAPGHRRTAFALHLGSRPEVTDGTTIGFDFGNHLGGLVVDLDEMDKNVGTRT
jgi:hypothetical protein